TQVEARLREWEESARHRVGETWIWMLVPSGEAGSPDVKWAETRVTGSEGLAERCSRKLRAEEALVTAYSGARLRMDLDGVPLWPDDHISTRELWGYYAQSLYLSRLRDVSVLARAIEDGVAKLDWDPGTFAYADAWNEESKRYVGLVAGSHPTVRIDAASLLVKPEVARRQFEEEAPKRPPGPGPGPEPRPGPGPGPEPGSEPEHVARRFFGVRTLDPQRVSRDADQVATEIVRHLAGLVDAKVEVKLEISA